MHCAIIAAAYIFSWTLETGLQSYFFMDILMLVLGVLLLTIIGLVQNGTGPLRSLKLSTVTSNTIVLLIVSVLGYIGIFVALGLKRLSLPGILIMKGLLSALVFSCVAALFASLVSIPFLTYTKYKRK